MKILAHRANLSGPHSSQENSLQAVDQALAAGFGVETDLRRDLVGRFYISHDAAAWSLENDFAAFEKVFRQHPAETVAMNVKELGYEDLLIALFRSGALGSDAFYFDFELLESSTPGRSQKKLRQLPGGSEVRLASRLSDRGEGLAQCLATPGEVVWGDEFDSLWLTTAEMEAIKNAGREVYLISPEIHGFDAAARKKRWEEFKAWDIDGLCTDFAWEARDFFGK